MSEIPFAITKINDFIFCPASIFFHEIDSDTDLVLAQSETQINGRAIHSATDNGHYSSRKSVLQNLGVYSSQYNLYGKIDVFDVESGVLTERKKHINRIYDGFVFQLYAQCFALREMGYEVRSIRLYGYDTNTVYPLTMPEDDPVMLKKFESTVASIDSFELCTFKQMNIDKCRNCIYEPMCSFSLLG